MHHIITTIIPEGMDVQNAYNQFIKFMTNHEFLFASHTSNNELVVSEKAGKDSIKFECPHYDNVSFPELLTQNILIWHSEYYKNILVNG